MWLGWTAIYFRNGRAPLRYRMSYGRRRELCRAPQTYNADTRAPHTHLHSLAGNAVRTPRHTTRTQDPAIPTADPARRARRRRQLQDALQQDAEAEGAELQGEGQREREVAIQRQPLRTNPFANRSRSSVQRVWLTVTQHGVHCRLPLILSGRIRGKPTLVSHAAIRTCFERLLKT